MDVQFWPHRQDLDRLRFVTPIPAIELNCLAAIARRIADRHALEKILWRPASRANEIPGVARILQGVAATGVTCDSLPDAARAAAAGAGDIMLLLPPVAGNGPAQLATLARSATVRVACDHFRQAELISDAFSAAGRTVELLLRIDVGRDRIGVRPGTDLRDLARGVSTLPGMRLGGLLMDAAGRSKLSPTERLRVLDHCASIVSRHGLSSGSGLVLSVGDLRDLPPRPDLPGLEARSPLPTRKCCAIVSGVVGRPTRDQAVIDAGRNLLGKNPTFAAGANEGLQFAAVEARFSILRLTGAARDLAIGDVVTLSPSRPVQLRIAGFVLLHDTAWRLEVLPEFAFSDRSC